VSGGGIINDAATNTSSNHMCTLEGVTNIAVENVTIENSSEEHLVTEADTNLTINNVTIQDSKIQSNTDGIDFSGSNVLIENCNISDGDDDIVAKPQSTYCSNIIINNCTITNGHGISIGGQTNAGLNGMYVNSCTINMANATNAIGIHLKAGDGNTTSLQNGGPVSNVTFNNISINNVDDAIEVDSYYNNGSSNFPDIPASVAPTDSTEPLWSDITFENITINSTTSNAANIYGLNSTPANTDGIDFINVTGTNIKNPWNMYYADDVYMSGVSVNGVTIPDELSEAKGSGGKNEAQEADDTFDASANPIYVPTVPEPASAGIAAIGAMLVIRRRRPRMDAM
jgi:polygalacturonase